MAAIGETLFPLADPGGAHGAPPPNGRGPMFFYAQNANFCSRLILSIMLIEIWQKHAK